MTRSEDPVGDGDGRRERDGGTLNGQRGSFRREDLGRLPRSIRSPVALTGTSPEFPTPVDNGGQAITPWSWKYPLELRRRAVRMVAEVRPDYDTEWAAMKAVAQKLGIGTTETLRKWVRRDQVDAGERGDMLTTAERGELAALRKENAQLKRANEVLRTASAFFAAQLDPTRPR
ncbi:transposase [Streptomyces lavendulae]|uniref:transposase n=2 Tax=Streptomyces lavendulae TaxID=1914 RepID=UPI0036A9D8F9